MMLSEDMIMDMAMSIPMIIPASIRMVMITDMTIPQDTSVQYVFIGR